MRLLKILVFMIFCTTVVGCKPDTKVYRKAIEGPIQTLNPRQTRMRTDFILAKTIFGQLLTYNSVGNIQPGILKTWQVSDEGTKYTFTIDPTNKFQDGNSISIEDVIFTFHYLAAKESLIARHFSNIDGADVYFENRAKTISGIRKLSENTFEVNLKRKSFVFLAQLADPKVVLLPKDLRGKTEADFFNSPIGAGSYRLKEMNKDRSHLVLERFDDFYGGKSNIQRFEFTVHEKSEALELFKKGELEDLEVYIFDNQELQELRKTANLYSTSSYSINLLILNGRKPYFQSKEVRNELSSAIDIDELGKACKGEIVPTSGLVPQGLLGWMDKSDPEVKSKRTNSKGRTLKVLAYGRTPRPCVMDSISRGFGSLGYDVTLDYRSEEEAVKIFLSGGYDLLFEDLSVRGPEPLNIFSFFDPNSPHNLTYFKDSVIGQKLSLIESMLGGQRGIAYADLSHYISHVQSYAIPLYTDIRVFLFSKNVKSDDSPAILLGNTPFEKVNL